jgi:5-methylcytosine-specific restriction endonuclease McrA
MAGQLKRYLAILKQIRAERGEHCEACGLPAIHGHHIVPCSETGIASELVFEPANIMLLCSECHSLMHPCIRDGCQWGIAKRGRGQALSQR